jgi:chromosome segregation ATPase
MTDEPDAPDLLGRPVDEAVDAVAGADDRDPETVRAVLDTVAEDGVVTEAGIQSALAHASTVVSTPETRVENASIALDDARDAAREVRHLDVVRDRLDAFAARLASVETRVDDLGDDLQAVVERADDPDSVYAVAADIRRLVGQANAVQRAADDLALDVEDFERWLAAPDRRRRELAGDADAMDRFLDDLAAATDDLAAATDDEADLADPAGRWLDATLRARVSSLLIADLRAELADLRAWPEDGNPADGDVPSLDDLENRIDDLDGRCDRLRERLDDLARPAWRERHADRLDALEGVLDEFEPPVDWEDVQAALDDHRLGIGAS